MTSQQRLRLIRDPLDSEPWTDAGRPTVGNNVDIHELSLSASRSRSLSVKDLLEYFYIIDFPFIKIPGNVEDKVIGRTIVPRALILLAGPKINSGPLSGENVTVTEP